MSIKKIDITSEYIKEKIFYISLQRSGTKSFGEFFRLNGYQVVSWRESRKNRWGLQSLNGNYDKILNNERFRLGEVFEDGPWFHIPLWKYLYWKSDNYRFVFFERPFEDWFSSMLSHSNGKNPGAVKNHSILYNCLDDYYRKVDSNDSSKLDLLGRKDVYARAYDNHRFQIRSFFEDKDPDRFFCADLYDKSKYRKLAKHFKLDLRYLEDVHIHKSASSSSLGKI